MTAPSKKAGPRPIVWKELALAVLLLSAMVFVGWMLCPVGLVVTVVTVSASFVAGTLVAMPFDEWMGAKTKTKEYRNSVERGYVWGGFITYIAAAWTFHGVAPPENDIRAFVVATTAGLWVLWTLLAVATKAIEYTYEVPGENGQTVAAPVDAFRAAMINVSSAIAFSVVLGIAAAEPTAAAAKYLNLTAQ